MNKGNLLGEELDLMETDNRRETMTNDIMAPRSRFSIWVQAIRVFSLTASLIPVLAAAALAVGQPAVAWWLLPLAILAAECLHAGTNLVSDYFDFVHQVDKNYTFGSSRVIVEGWLSPRKVFWGGMALLATSAAIGLVFIAVRGWPILVIGIIGLLGGYFYTARPVGLKYLALGDLSVFVLMGPLMVVGAYLVLTGEFHHRVWLVSLPIGCLVTAILHANNTRDIPHDRQAGVRTMANLLGHRGAVVEYESLVLAAYGLTAVLIATGHISVWGSLVMLSVPIAIRNLRIMRRSVSDQPKTIEDLDVKTAQLHLAFGILYVLGITIGRL
jgi:1,4-dihydroxy-2-naphthoate polyprenyltransferase